MPYPWARTDAVKLPGLSTLWRNWTLRTEMTIAELRSFDYTQWHGIGSIGYQQIQDAIARYDSGERHAHNDVCSVDGCQYGTYARTWCEYHYKRWQTTGGAGTGPNTWPGHGPVTAPDRRFGRRQSETCVFDGCGRSPTVAHSLCGSHAKQRQRGEDLKPIRKYTRV